ncbi:MAG: scramblase [Elusimicrobia bacterium]|nr:scramblase [Elusimicrobiota bacterium]
MSALLERGTWVIQQKKEWGEILVNLETRNKYEVLSENGEPLGFVAEEGTGFLQFLKRMLLRRHRPFVITIFDKEGKPALRVRRPWFWIWSSTFVEDGGGRPVGSIHRKFRWLSRRFDVLDASGQVAAGVDAGFWRIWTFDLVDASGAKMGTITKKWGGLLKEVFTDADRFLVVLDGQTAPRTDDAKAAILGAALALDFDYFEDNQRS